MSIAVILNAIAAIPALVSGLESFAAAVTAWYCQRATNETLQAISNAAALAAHAKTDQDRYAAALAWQNALSRSRISSS